MGCAYDPAPYAVCMQGRCKASDRPGTGGGGGAGTPSKDGQGDAVPACPDTDTHRYVAAKDVCKRIRYRCDAGEVPFSDDCGCGCRTDG